MGRFAFLDLLFPPRCAGCERAGALLCEECSISTEPLRFDIGAFSCVALGSYDGVLRRSVLRMKKGRRDIGERLGTLLAHRLEAFVEPGVCLIPVPTTRARRAARGFDQAELLARVAGSELGRRVLIGVERIAGVPQQGRTRRERLEMRGRFALPRGVCVRGQKVVLVDDVATTGATLREAAAVLKAGGACVRGGLLVARADA